MWNAAPRRGTQGGGGGGVGRGGADGGERGADGGERGADGGERGADGGLRSDFFLTKNKEPGGHNAQRAEVGRRRNGSHECLGTSRRCHELRDG